MFAALLLDLDGTVVDSEPKHVEAHRRFLAGQGLTPSDDELYGNIGKGDREFYGDLLRRAARGDADVDAWLEGKTDTLIGLYRDEGLGLRPGVRDLLDHAWEQGVTVCVVTSSTRRLAAAALAAVGLGDRLGVRVCFEDTVAHKPDPAPYLLAARRLGVPPQRCLAVEDSVSGVTAAVGAGCLAVGFAGLVPADRLRSAGAALAVTDLAGLVPFAVLAGLATGARGR